jgi:hypothetical protein
MSPTVLRIGPYKFFFYADEGDEPRHIHVWSGNGQAKFWLEPVEPAKSWGYNDRELNRIERLIEDNLEFLVKAWDDFFGVGNDN